jgi:hypothetical protein
MLEDAHRQLSGVATDAAAELARRRGPQPEAHADEYTLWAEVQSLSQFAEKSLQRTAEESNLAQGLKAWDAGSATSEPANRLVSTTRPAEPAGLHDNPGVVDETNDADLLKTLGAAVKVCRKARLPLSLILAEADRREPDKQTAAERAFWIEELGHFCHALEFPSKICLQVRPARWALVLLGADRSAAAALASEILQQVRACTTQVSKPEITASLGAATVPVPSPNFSPRTLLEASGRCLYGAQIAGNTIKGIEIY